MIAVANIKLWGDFVGAVLWDEATQTASFEYDRAFAVNLLRSKGAV